MIGHNKRVLEAIKDNADVQVIEYIPSIQAVKEHYTLKIDPIAVPKRKQSNKEILAGVISFYKKD